MLVRFAILPWHKGIYFCGVFCSFTNWRYTKIVTCTARIPSWYRVHVNNEEMLCQEGGLPVSVDCPVVLYSTGCCCNGFLSNDLFGGVFVFSADVWQQILVPILRMRKEAGLVNLFPQYITGEVSELHNMLTAILFFFFLRKAVWVKSGLLLLPKLTFFSFLGFVWFIWAICAADYWVGKCGLICLLVCCY